jgi:S-adenosylmethionine decarboxylase
LGGGKAEDPREPFVRREHGWQFIQCDSAAAFGEWLNRDEMGLPPGVNEEPSLGSHLLIEMFGCDADALKAECSVGCAMREAAVASQATVVAQSFHEFRPYGVSGAVIIQESHYTIHTWPEHGYAAVDLFYCGGTVLVHNAVDVLRERFRPTNMKFLVVRRGIESEVHGG